MCLQNCHRLLTNQRQWHSVIMGRSFITLHTLGPNFTPPRNAVMIRGDESCCCRFLGMELDVGRCMQRWCWCCRVMIGGCLSTPYKTSVLYLWIMWDHLSCLLVKMRGGGGHLLCPQYFLRPLFGIILNIGENSILTRMLKYWFHLHLYYVKMQVLSPLSIVLCNFGRFSM